MTGEPRPTWTIPPGFWLIVVPLGVAFWAVVIWGLAALLAR